EGDCPPRPSDPHGPLERHRFPYFADRLQPNSRKRPKPTTSGSIAFDPQNITNLSEDLQIALTISRQGVRKSHGRRCSLSIIGRRAWAQIGGNAVAWIQRKTQLMAGILQAHADPTLERRLVVESNRRRKITDVPFHSRTVGQIQAGNNQINSRE